MAMAGPTVTNTVTLPMPTAIDPRLLVLTQWLSPAYPIGAFAYSHGLEAAISLGWITSPEQLEDWLRDVLTEGTGRADAIWIDLAHSAAQPVETLDTLARAYAPSAERLREAVRQGEAFAAISAEVWQIPVPGAVLPVALGHAAAQAGLEKMDCKALYLQGFVSNLVAAAQRLMPLGQSDAQRIVARLSPLCAQIAEDTDGAAVTDVQSNAFLSDIAAMRHEDLEVRVFQS